jgi:quercetin dioxygenase-like cupin family protein
VVSCLARGSNANWFTECVAAEQETTSTQEVVMSSFEQQRRSLLFALGGLGVGPLLPGVLAAKQPGAKRGSVLGPAEGEHLVHFRDRGHIFIKLGSANGSPDLAMGTQQVMAGTGIPIHRHLKMVEAFYVLEGSGTVVLDDVRHPFEKGGTIFIPANTWHGFENPAHELLLLWIVSPAGLDGFFRNSCSAPGAPARALTREQIREIALRHDTEFR